jgi:hypothetical protein
MGCPEVRRTQPLVYSRTNAVTSGYLQKIDLGRLVRVADRCDAVICMAFRPGELVLEGETLAYVMPAARRTDLVTVIHGAVMVGQHRPLEQDIETYARLALQVRDAFRLSPRPAWTDGRLGPRIAGLLTTSQSGEASCRIRTDRGTGRSVAVRSLTCASAQSRPIRGTRKPLAVTLPHPASATTIHRPAELASSDSARTLVSRRPRRK